MRKLQEPFLTFWTNQHPRPSYSLKGSLTEVDEKDPYYLLKKAIQQQASKNEAKKRLF